MNVISKYIVSYFMLVLLLFYSSPIKSLHACNQLNHHHSEPEFDIKHEQCLICDLQFQAFLTNEKTELVKLVKLYPEFCEFHISQDYFALRDISYNKGPPSIV